MRWGAVGALAEMNSKGHAEGSKPATKGTWLHLYEMSRQGKSTEAEGR